MQSGVLQLQDALRVAANAAVTKEARIEACMYIDECKSRPDIIHLAQYLISAARDDQSLYLALKLLDDGVRMHWASLSVSGQTELRNVASSLVQEAALPSSVSPLHDLACKHSFTAAKLAQIVSTVAKRQYPREWPSFTSDMLSLSCLDGHVGALIGLGAIDSVAAECISDSAEGDGGVSKGYGIAGSFITSQQRSDVLSGLKADVTSLLPGLYALLTKWFSKYSTRVSPAEEKSGKQVTSLALKVLLGLIGLMSCSALISPGHNFAEAAFSLLANKDFRSLSLEIIEKILELEIYRDEYIILLNEILKAMGTVLSSPLDPEDEEELNFRKDFIAACFDIFSINIDHLRDRHKDMLDPSLKDLCNALLQACLAATTSIPSRRLLHRIAKPWVRFLSNPLLESMFENDIICENLLNIYIAMSAKVIWSASSNSPLPPYDSDAIFMLEFESLEEYQEFYGIARSSTSDLLRAIVKVKPILAAQYALSYTGHLVQMYGSAVTDCDGSRGALMIESFLPYLEVIVQAIGSEIDRQRDEDESTKQRITIAFNHLGNLTYGVLNWSPKSSAFGFLKIRFIEALSKLITQDSTLASAAFQMLFGCITDPVTQKLAGQTIALLCGKLDAERLGMQFLGSLFAASEGFMNSCDTGRNSYSIRCSILQSMISLCLKIPDRSERNLRLQALLSSMGNKASASSRFATIMSLGSEGAMTLIRESITNALGLGASSDSLPVLIEEFGNFRDLLHLTLGALNASYFTRKSQQQNGAIGGPAAGGTGHFEIHADDAFLVLCSKLIRPISVALDTTLGSYDPRFRSHIEGAADGVSKLASYMFYAPVDSELTGKYINAKLRASMSSNPGYSASDPFGNSEHVKAVVSAAMPPGSASAMAVPAVVDQLDYLRVLWKETWGIAFEVIGTAMQGRYLFAMNGTQTVVQLLQIVSKHIEYIDTSCLSQVISLVVQPSLVHFAMEMHKHSLSVATGSFDDHREELSYKGFLELSEAISPILEHALRRARRMYTAASLDLNIVSAVYMPMVSYPGLAASLQACYAPYIDSISPGQDLVSLVHGVHSGVERLDTEALLSSEASLFHFIYRHGSVSTSCVYAAKIYPDMLDQIREGIRLDFVRRLFGCAVAFSFVTDRYGNKSDQVEVSDVEAQHPEESLWGSEHPASSTSPKLRRGPAGGGSSTSLYDMGSCVMRWAMRSKREFAANKTSLFDILISIALFGIACGTPLNTCDDSVVRQRTIDVIQHISYTFMKHGPEVVTPSTPCFCSRVIYTAVFGLLVLSATPAATNNATAKRGSNIKPADVIARYLAPIDAAFGSHSELRRFVSIVASAVSATSKPGNNPHVVSEPPVQWEYMAAVEPLQVMASMPGCSFDSLKAMCIDLSSPKSGKKKVRRDVLKEAFASILRATRGLSAETRSTLDRNGSASQSVSADYESSLGSSDTLGALFASDS